jgi:tetratricopeptide (TPR) repeat protein
LTRALQLGARQTRVYFIRSRLRQQMGDQAGAKADFDKGLSLEPSDEVSWISRGVAQQDPQLALRDYRGALECNPRSTNALQNIAHVYAEKLQQLDSAIEALEKILAINSDDATVIATRGVLRARQGKRGQAHADAHLALQLRADADTQYRVAGIFALTSQEFPADAQRAIQLLSSAFWKDPGLVSQMIANDPDLKPMTDTPAFKHVRELVAEYLKFLQSL